MWMQVSAALERGAAKIQTPLTGEEVRCKKLWLLRFA